MSNQADNIEALHIHIEGLQATLAKRKERIAELEALVAQLKANPVASAAEKKSYKQGWQACADHLMETTRKAALDLNQIRRDAFTLYLEGEKK